MKRVTIDAPAKINWSLDIVGKREDGYHLLKMVMQEIALFDRVTLSEANEDRIYCNISALGNQDNIAMRAWLLLKDRFSLQQGLSIQIEKNIPLAGGLAGGSADAAAVLKGANELFALGLEEKSLREIGLQLGADVPFCLLGQAALAEGVGEILTPLKNLSRQEIVLANPGIPVPTAEIFREFSFGDIADHPHTEELIFALQRDDKKKIGLLMANLLETVTLKKYPVINELKEDMKRLGLAPLMSGSGGSVFGLAEDAKSAAYAIERLKMKWPFAGHTYTL